MILPPLLNMKNNHSTNVKLIDSIIIIWVCQEHFEKRFYDDVFPEKVVSFSGIMVMDGGLII